MAFDKAAYWKQKKARQAMGLAPGEGALVVCCRRCLSTKGTLISTHRDYGDFFVCQSRCDQRPLWQRVKFFFGVGRWRVVYMDGEVSRPMSARAAKNYYGIFKAAALIATEKPIVDLGLK